MSRIASKPLVVRVSENDIKQLRKIRECGDWDNDSAAIRFCIRFTKTMFAVLPAALVENFVQVDENEVASVDKEPTSSDVEIWPEDVIELPIAP